MPSKKLGTDVFLGRFARQSFYSVFTELENVAVFVRTRPSAALAVKAIFFVYFQPIADPSDKTGFPSGKFQTLDQRVHTGRDAVRLSQLCRRLFIRRLSSACWCFLSHLALSVVLNVGLRIFSFKGDGKRM